jgi:hypothetical protein
MQPHTPWAPCGVELVFVPGLAADVAFAITRRIETVAWKPRVQIYHNFITEEEARHIVSLAAPQVRRCTPTALPHACPPDTST